VQIVRIGKNCLPKPGKQAYNISIGYNLSTDATMGKPQEAIEEALLRLLSQRTGAMRMNAIYAHLAEQFGLTRSQRWGNPFDAKGSPWEFLVRLARRDLQDAGWLEADAQGGWRLTPAGRARMESSTTETIRPGPHGSGAPHLHH
jgi:hypothetical protein